jgi:hypothetical protein
LGVDVVGGAGGVGVAEVVLDPPPLLPKLAKSQPLRATTSASITSLSAAWI